MVYSLFNPSITGVIFGAGTGSPDSRWGWVWVYILISIDQISGSQLIELIDINEDACSLA